MVNRTFSKSDALAEGSANSIAKIGADQATAILDRFAPAHAIGL